MIENLKQELENNQLNFDELQNEKNQLVNEMNLLIIKIENFEREKSEQIQVFRKKLFRIFYI